MGNEGIKTGLPDVIGNWKSGEVQVGSLTIGGTSPLRIQSMTSTDTRQTEETLQQIRRLAEAGCELVRCTTQGKRELRALASVRKKLRKEGVPVPLAADVHYLPHLALEAAGVVDKVRINPGNYGIGPRQQALAPEEARKLQKEYFTRLIHRCRETGTAIRVGVNHGSLSEHIMQEYGDTPEGMAESAMEFLRVCRNRQFPNVIVSLKSSNTRVMVQATRLLVWKMWREDMHYPLHLGVTEAGEGEDGRIKSAVGIAGLLIDGIGDTIRVSLTEDPVKEIPVAKKIARYSLRMPAQGSRKRPVSFLEWERRKTFPVLNAGGDHPPVLITGLNEEKIPAGGKNTGPSADFFFASSEKQLALIPPGKAGIVPYVCWQSLAKKPSRVYPLLDSRHYADMASWKGKPFFAEVTATADIPRLADILKSDLPAILVIRLPDQHAVEMLEECFYLIHEHGLGNPVILRKKYSEPDPEDLLIRASCETGPFCLDGLVDGLWLEGEKPFGPDDAASLGAGILQATRLRMYHNEYISCPSCGRTLFNIQKVTARVREKTRHLNGLRIAVMGCMVNGPGEMADADYGYVGAGPGKVHLYRKKQPVLKNIPEEEALKALEELMRKEGHWVDPA
ncbi:MAG TPA: 4-hydroxy-3-methylbut-2-en-1-yl diphosphate synthase [Bacteroidetes bacterium]|nr:4-hydroxy-3-methylbut-2-en-1-yl diphosphate synthase [Bacteroidota bacterium]